jgi:hypothetical protein
MYDSGDNWNEIQIVSTVNMSALYALHIRGTRMIVTVSKSESTDNSCSYCGG